MASTMSENGPAAMVDETSQPITSEALEEIRVGLSKVHELLATLKSPLDGIIALLESITIIEVDDNNELKPIHQSAKDTLDQYQAIKSSLKSISKDKDWTYSSVIKVISEMGERIQHLFAAFRSLEEFGLERQGDEQKQISEAHEQDTTGQAVEISSYPALRQVMKSRIVVVIRMQKLLILTIKKLLIRVLQHSDAMHKSLVS